MSSFVIIFSISLMVYMLAMYAIGYIAQRRVRNVDDYVLAGRRLPVSLTTITIIATWFGAESLMTTADEVAQQGWRGALLDPIGISLCLLITGLFVAGPMWRMNLLTIPDFFRERYGKLAEILASIILVPSYFGWIAAQYVALATILSQIYGLGVSQWIILIAIGGTGYAMMGGMWSITWTDTLQLVLIVLGLVVVGFEILTTLGEGSVGVGMMRLRMDSPPSHWRWAEHETYTKDMLAAISALAIGALGNLPVQDLMQRVFSARSPRVASLACYLGAAGYLAMCLLPVATGLAAGLILAKVPEQGVMTAVASQLLSPPLLIIFLLAVVSAVLSTIVSAVMAPAAVLAHNLLEPLIVASHGPLTQRQELRLLRGSAVAVAGASVALALSGQGAYELVQSSYAMSLVGMFVPFMAGIYLKSLPPLAANLSMAVGIASWFVHVVMGWDYFFEPHLGGSLPIPHELVDTGLSAVAFLACLPFRASAAR
ncbi:MAG: sodium:solute symporter family protein [Aureliella sp.]